MKEAKLKFTKVNGWVWRKLPACKEIVKLVTASLDGRLTFREWIVMKVHLYSCDSCINFLKQVRFIRTTLRHSDEGLDNENSSVMLSDDARTRIKNAVRFSASDQ
jgi:hypothetical protein